MYTECTDSIFSRVGTRETLLSDIQQVAITNIRVTDLTPIDLRRIPAGFYVEVLANDVQWQTTNKPVHADLDVLEWNERIVLSSKASCKIQFSIYASFELGPMLGHGYLLRTFRMSVAELLNHSQNSRPIAFRAKKGKIISPCTLLLISVEHTLAYEADVDVLRPIIPSTHYDTSELTLTTDTGHFILARYCRTRNNPDLDHPIAYFERSRDLCTVDHPCRSAALVNLAITKLIICQVHENYPDLDIDIVISLFEDALNLRPIGHPDRPATQLNLAIALLSRFTKRGFHMDADSAKELLNEVLDACHAKSSIYRSALLAIETSALLPAKNTDPNDFWVKRLISSILPLSVNELHHRAELCLRSGDLYALDEVISLHCDALKYYSTALHHRSILLSNQGEMLRTRCVHRGDDKDVDEAIRLLREPQTLWPVGHPYRNSPLRLSRLASALWTRFEHRGDDKDLEEAITLNREALTLRPVGHPYQDVSLIHLANALSVRFRHRGDDEDLEEGIMLYRRAQTLRPVGHPNRDEPLHNLASALSIRFKHRGDDKDLDDAITLHREALTLQPVGYRYRSPSLSNLASALLTRFRHRGDGKDLDEAITLHKDGLTLRPVGHPDRYASLNNLANALSIRLHRGDDKDLDEAITLLREAQTLQLVGHPYRDQLLHNLARVLLTRFEDRGDDEDLNETITLHREALTLRPVGHPDRPSALINLASAFSARFDHRGDDKDLDNALANARSALTQLTKHHPHHLQVNTSLATIYLSLHRLGLNGTSNDIDNLNTAIHHLKAAVDSVSSGLLHRLRASLTWVRTAKRYTHSSLLEAYATSIQLLDAYISATASVSSRHHAMKEFPATLAVDAASCALQCGNVCRAVEVLEQGRTLIWTQMARFRTPLDSLLERGDHAQALVKKFREVSSSLDKPPAQLPEGTPKVHSEAEATRYSRLVDDWNNTVQEIRMVEGFSRFMLPPVFSDLQDAARGGPIIVLIASKSFCDAIIIPFRHSPTRVQLRTSLERLQCLVTTLQQTVQLDPQGKQTRVNETVEAEPEIDPPEKQTRLVEVLRELWDDVVCHVVEKLDGFAQPGSRIWWCPTFVFNFLPLHAAGAYKPGRKNLSHSYVSSYTPSLTALIRARRNRDKSLPIHFAAIGQNLPQGFEHPLSSVESELELVRSLLPPSPTISFTKVTSAESTKSTALCTLRDNQWLHFACHGKQNFVEPFASAFLMRDQPLTLLDITQTDLFRHQFAFLSACETAVGATEHPDEVIHLAAGLQFAGVKSVIGTFWGVEDETVRHLVMEFYKNLCGDGDMNSKRAARALHKAVRSLANNKGIALDQRIVFMHIGL